MCLCIALRQAGTACDLSRCKRKRRTQSVTSTPTMVTVTSYTKLHSTFIPPSQELRISSTSAVNRHPWVRSRRVTEAAAQSSLSTRSPKNHANWQIDFTRVSMPWLQYAIHHWKNIPVKHKDDHLDQALLYQDAEMEVLLHRFDKAGVQSYVHNHKASFLSYCLSGHYVETKWKVDLHSDGTHIEYTRQPDGKLGSPLWQPGMMKVLDKTVFSAGQSKPIFYTDLHSINSFTHDKPVTLVIRHKDEDARGRATTCYMVSCDDGGEQVLSHALSTSRDQDRPASEVEKADMLEVLKGIEGQLQVCRATADSPAGPQDHLNLVLLTRGLMHSALQP